MKLTIAVRSVNRYLQVLRLRALLEEAESRARDLATAIPPHDLHELITNLHESRKTVERLLATYRQ